MNKSNATVIEQGIGSDVDHFGYRVPKKNHDTMMQLDKQFADIQSEFSYQRIHYQIRIAYDNDILYLWREVLSSPQGLESCWL